MFKRKELDVWLRSRVTKEFLDLVREHKEAPYEYVTQVVMNAPNLKDLDLCKVAEFRGQVHALNLISDLENFLTERVINEEDTTQSHDG